MSLGWQLPPLYETLKTFTSVFVYQKKKKSVPNSCIQTFSSLVPDETNLSSGSSTVS